jgi:hypothetical protein
MQWVSLCIDEAAVAPELSVGGELLVQTGKQRLQVNLKFFQPQAQGARASSLKEGGQTGAVFFRPRPPFHRCTDGLPLQIASSPFPLNLCAPLKDKPNLVRRQLYGVAKTYNTVGALHLDPQGVPDVFASSLVDDGASGIPDPDLDLLVAGVNVRRRLDLEPAKLCERLDVSGCKFNIFHGISLVLGTRTDDPRRRLARPGDTSSTCRPWFRRTNHLAGSCIRTGT